MFRANTYIAPIVSTIQRWFHPGARHKIADDRRQTRHQHILIVSDRADETGVEIAVNVKHSLRYAHVSFDEVDLSSEPVIPELDAYTCIVFSTSTIEDFDGETALQFMNYVEAGGALVVARPAWCTPMAPVFGFTAVIDHPGYRVNDNTGCVFCEDLFPGFRGHKLDPQKQIAHCGINAIPSKACELVCGDEHGSPVCWIQDFGRGRALYWNSIALSERGWRGHIVQSVMLAMGYGVTRLAGFGMIHVDDFPPANNSDAPAPIDHEFPGLDADAFYWQIWLPDMASLKREFDVDLTYYCIMNYADTTGESLDLNQTVKQQAKTVTYDEAFRGRFLTERSAKFLRQNEIGFHGYNHNPMVKSNWADSSELMSAAVSASQEIWNAMADAPQPRSFVPANNEFDATGISLVSRAFPTISSVCGLYTRGDYARGQQREFGPEPFLSGLFHLPRETWGYWMTGEERSLAFSQIASIGCWTHFLHPDDVLDTRGYGPNVPARNPENRPWRGDKADDCSSHIGAFRHWLGLANACFPWLDYVTTTQAEQRMKLHLSDIVAVAFERDKFDVFTDHGGKFAIRLPKEMSVKKKRQTAFRLVSQHQVQGGQLVVVELPRGQTSIHLCHT